VVKVRRCVVESEAHMLLHHSCEQALAAARHQTANDKLHVAGGLTQQEIYGFGGRCDMRSVRLGDKAYMLRVLTLSLAPNVRQSTCSNASVHMLLLVVCAGGAATAVAAAASSSAVPLLVAGGAQYHSMLVCIECVPQCCCWCCHTCVISLVPVGRSSLRCSAFTVYLRAAVAAAAVTRV
jgi:hypothetical protein